MHHACPHPGGTWGALGMAGGRDTHGGPRPQRLHAQGHTRGCPLPSLPTCRVPEVDLRGLSVNLEGGRVLLEHRGDVDLAGDRGVGSGWLGEAPGLGEGLGGGLGGWTRPWGGSWDTPGLPQQHQALGGWLGPRGAVGHPRCWQTPRPRAPSPVKEAVGGHGQGAARDEGPGAAGGL